MGLLYKIMMKIVAVIPVHGRLPLLEITIRRLYRKNKIDKVICVGDNPDDKTLCKKAGAAWCEHKNKPLGEKWNAGFVFAKEHYDPDYVLYVGSSDWVSDNWIPVTLEFLQANDFDVVGKPDYNMLHYGKELFMCHWTGYPSGSWRENEPIGIGRILSKKFLDKIGWQPFESFLDASMDWCMVQKLIKIPGHRFGSFNSVEIQSLSLSCDAWDNMHKVSVRADLPNTYRIYQPKAFLKMWFPEALELKLNK